MGRARTSAAARFAVGEVAGFVAEVREGLLLVERERVVDFAADVVVR